MLVEQASGGPLQPTFVARLSRLLPAVSLVVSRGASVLAQLLVQVVVGALGGAAGLGVLQLFTAWSSAAGEVLARGQPVAALRATAVAHARGDAAAIRSAAQVSVAGILRASLVALACGFLVLLLIRSGDWLSVDAVWVPVMAAAMVAAPLLALARLGAEMLKGMAAPLTSITVENLGPPLAILTVCAVAWLAGDTLGRGALLLGATGSSAVTAGTLWWLFRRRLFGMEGASGVAGETLVVPASEQQTLWASSVLSVFYVQIPFFVLPHFTGVEQVGVFAVAYKLVNVITTLLLLQAAVFAPAFARAAAASDTASLRRLLRRTQLLSLTVFGPLAVILLLAREPLGQLFNLPPGALTPFLAILVAGQLVNAATGLPGVLLNMSGRARAELYSLAGATLFMVALSPWVGSHFGAPGLACLFSAGIAAKNLAAFGAACYLLHGERSR